ncbi:MAG: fumarylacetoacetate hydrolase family protein [Fimbriimonadaceae bacterium]
MKLCRFLVVNRPDEPRTGVFHEGKIYETDGQSAAGIHEPANVQFLSPIGQPPAVRLFEQFEMASGEWIMSYFFMNPAQLKGTNDSLSMPPQVEELGFEIRVAGVLQDGDQMIEPKEAERYLLGYTFMLCFTDRSLQLESDSSPAMWTESHDIGALLSPFLITPDEMSAYLIRETKSGFQFVYSIYINEIPIIVERTFSFDVEFYDLLQRASLRSPLNTGEVVAWPSLPIPDLETTDLERNIEPGDKIRVVIEGLGAITSTVG